jgi:site-specific recombinase XerD
MWSQPDDCGPERLVLWVTTANRGIDTRTIQSYLGHNNIQHTARYTELVSTKLQWLWDS